MIRNKFKMMYRSFHFRQLYVFIVITIFVFNSNLIYAQLNRNNVEVKWNTNTDKRSIDKNTKRKIPLNEFSVVSKPNFIPVIDRAEFVKNKLAEKLLYAYEPIVVVELSGRVRAYPLRILLHHELINDQIGDKPVLISFCTLCNTSVVFNRIIKYQGMDLKLDFGNPGMLRKGNMTLYDRQTESWWQQSTGEALVGDMAGTILKEIPSFVISYKDYCENYPDSLIMSSNTGYKYNYEENIYAGYENTDTEQPLFFPESVDDRLPAMERVIHFSGINSKKIYPYSVIKKMKVINDEFNNSPLVIFYEDKTVSVLDDSLIRNSVATGSVNVFSPVIDGTKFTFNKSGNSYVDQETSSTWTITGNCIAGKFKGRKLKMIQHGCQFAYSWFSFHPDTEIYR